MGHLADKRNCLLRYLPGMMLHPGFLLPEMLKELAMPTQQRFWLDNPKEAFPIWQQPCQEEQFQAVAAGDFGMFHLSFQYQQLLPEKSIFEQQGFARAGQASNPIRTRLT